MSYKLKLLLSMRRLYPIFYIVKLMATTEDTILGQHALLLLDLIIVDGEEE